jgi:hypothetical protein
MVNHSHHETETSEVFQIREGDANIRGWLAPSRDIQLLYYVNKGWNLSNSDGFLSCLVSSSSNFYTATHSKKYVFHCDSKNMYNNEWEIAVK